MPSSFAVVLVVLPFLSVNTINAPARGAPVAATPVTLLEAGVVELELLPPPPPPHAVNAKLIMQAKAMPN